MYSKTAVVASLAAVCGMSEAIFFDGGITIGTAAATAGATTIGISTGGAALLAVGAIALKGLALGALASRGRGRRSADSEVDAFTFIARAEPEQCIRRLICDLATGEMPKSENDVILTLFNEDTAITDSKFEFTTAAKLGKQVKNIQACEIRYSCPVSGKEIASLLN